MTASLIAEVTPQPGWVWTCKCCRSNCMFFSDAEKICLCFVFYLYQPMGTKSRTKKVLVFRNSWTSTGRRSVGWQFGKKVCMREKFVLIFWTTLSYKLFFQTATQRIYGQLKFMNSYSAPTYLNYLFVLGRWYQPMTIKRATKNLFACRNSWT